MLDGEDGGAACHRRRRTGGRTGAGVVVDAARFVVGASLVLIAVRHYFEIQSLRQVLWASGVPEAGAFPLLLPVAELAVGGFLVAKLLLRTGLLAAVVILLFSVGASAAVFDLETGGMYLPPSMVSVGLLACAFAALLSLRYDSRQ